MVKKQKDDENKLKLKDKLDYIKKIKGISQKKRRLSHSTYLEFNEEFMGKIREIKNGTLNNENNVRKEKNEKKLTKFHMNIDADLEKLNKIQKNTQEVTETDRKHAKSTKHSKSFQSIIHAYIFVDRLRGVKRKTKKNDIKLDPTKTQDKTILRDITFAKLLTTRMLTQIRKSDKREDTSNSAPSGPEELKKSGYDDDFARVFQLLRNIAFAKVFTTRMLTQINQTDKREDESKSVPPNRLEELNKSNDKSSGWFSRLVGNGKLSTESKLKSNRVDSMEIKDLIEKIPKNTSSQSIDSQGEIENADVENKVFPVARETTLSRKNENALASIVEAFLFTKRLKHKLKNKTNDSSDNTKSKSKKSTKEDEYFGSITNSKLLTDRILSQFRKKSERVKKTTIESSSQEMENGRQDPAGYFYNLTTSKLFADRIILKNSHREKSKSSIVREKQIKKEDPLKFFECLVRSKLLNDRLQKQARLKLNKVEQSGLIGTKSDLNLVPTITSIEIPFENSVSQKIFSNEKTITTTDTPKTVNFDHMATDKDVSTNPLDDETIEKAVLSNKNDKIRDDPDKRKVKRDVSEEIEPKIASNVQNFDNKTEKPDKPTKKKPKHSKSNILFNNYEEKVAHGTTDSIVDDQKLNEENDRVNAKVANQKEQEDVKNREDERKLRKIISTQGDEKRLSKAKKSVTSIHDESNDNHHKDLLKKKPTNADDRDEKNVKLEARKKSFKEEFLNDKNLAESNLKQEIEHELEQMENDDVVGLIKRVKKVLAKYNLEREKNKKDNNTDKVVKALEAIEKKSNMQLKDLLKNVNNTQKTQKKNSVFTEEKQKHVNEPITVKNNKLFKTDEYHQIKHVDKNLRKLSLHKNNSNNSLNEANENTTDHFKKKNKPKTKEKGKCVRDLSTLNFKKVNEDEPLDTSFDSKEILEQTETRDASLVDEQESFISVKMNKSILRHHDNETINQNLPFLQALANTLVSVPVSIDALSSYLQKSIPFHKLCQSVEQVGSQFIDVLKLKSGDCSDNLWLNLLRNEFVHIARVVDELKQDLDNCIEKISYENHHSIRPSRSFSCRHHRRHHHHHYHRTHSCKNGTPYL